MKTPIKIRVDNEGTVSIETIPLMPLPDNHYIIERTGEMVYSEHDVYERGYIIYDPKISAYN